MIEPYATYYDVNTMDIWEFEREKFISYEGSIKRVESVESKLRDFIFRCHNRKIKDINNQKIDSITDLKKLDSGTHSSGYFERYVRNWNTALKDIKERIAISIFPLHDGFFNLRQNIDVDPKEETFDFWFTLKLSQYDYSLKYLECFLNFQLDQNFNGDVNIFDKFLKTTILQFEEDYLSTRLVLLINKWFANHHQKIENELSNNAPSISETQNTKNSDKAIHKTFLLDILNNQPSIINNLKNNPTIELIEGFNILKSDNLLFGDVKWVEFNLIFQKEGLNDKIKWEGTLVELKWLIQEICKPGLCSHLENGLEKWKVAQDCFLIKGTDGWTKIESYKQISNANGSNRRLKSIERFGKKLSQMKL